MENSKTILCGGWDIDKFLEELIVDSAREVEPCSDEDWAEFVEGLAEHYGMSDDEKRSWLK